MMLQYILLLLFIFSYATPHLHAIEKTTLSTIENKNIEKDSLQLKREKAFTHYQTNDFKNAIAECEEILKQNEKDSPTQELLTEILIAASQEAYLLNNFEESYAYLSRANELTPNLSSMNQLYNKIKENQKKVEPYIKNTNTSPPADFKTFSDALEKIVKAQGQIVGQTQQSLAKVIEISSHQSKGIMDSLSKRENYLNQQLNFQKKYSIGLILGAFSLILTLIVLTLYLIQKISKRRERIWMEQSEHLAQIIQEHSGKTIEHLTQTLQSLQNNPPRLISESHSEIKNNSKSMLEHINIIDAEIIQEGTGNLDVNTIQSLLKDSNPEVKIKTLQVLLKLNPNEAYLQIEKLLSSSQNDDKILAIQVLSGIATTQSVNLLIPMTNLDNLEVKREAISALYLLLKEKLSTDLIDKINFTLEKAAESEGWIVK